MWACSAYGERTGEYKILVKKPEGKRPLGRPSRRWDVDIKMDLQYDGGVDWNDLAQDRDRCQAFMNGVMKFQIT